MSERHEQTDAHDAAPRQVGSGHDEGGKAHDGEPKCHKEQRWDAAHSPVDHHKVEAPQGGNADGEEGVSAIHIPRLPVQHHVEPAIDLRQYSVKLLHD